MRKIAADTIVLLKNETKILPLKADSLKKVAILGGNAKARVLSGGGSASLKPSFFVSPYDGIVQSLSKGTEVTYAEGARGKQTGIFLRMTVVKADSYFSIQDASNSRL